MKDALRRTERRQILRLPRKPVLAVAVFFPGNRLMHQASNWAVKWPQYELEFFFAQSLPEIQAALQGKALSIVDATEKPDRALAAFRRVVDELGASCSAVYTEKMHAGLELSVRGRGALLLLGPLSDALWEQWFDKIAERSDRVPRPTDATGQFARRGTGGREEVAWRKHPPHDPRDNRFRRIG